MVNFKNANLIDLYNIVEINSPETSEKKEQWKALEKKRVTNALNDENKEFVLALLNNKIVGHVFVIYKDEKHEFPQMQALLVDKDF